MRPLPKLAIFDMDGLIFDTEEMFFEQLRLVMKTYGYHMTRERYIETLGLAREAARVKMTGFFGTDYPFDEISAKARKSLNEIAVAQGLRVKKGITQLLHFFKTKDIPCCVASSSPSDVVALYLKSGLIYEYFTHIIGGEMISHSKPNPEIFLASCSAFQVAPSDAIVLEDSENGGRAAIAAGIPLILIPDMKIPQQEVLSKAFLVAADATEVIRNYS
ncbi:MAG: HAD family phosphatase [Eubacterium sp.]|nr:HAD family phosphatase [Eubacterium sp.]